MRIFRRTPISGTGARIVLLVALLCFQGIAIAQKQWSVFIFNEEHKPNITDRKAVLVSVRNQGDYSSEAISVNRRYWREHLMTDSLSWLGINRKARPLPGKVQCFYTLVKDEDKKIAFLEYTLPEEKSREAVKDPLSEFWQTIDVLNGHADYFVVLVKGESVKGMDKYISLLLKEPRVDKVVALAEQGDLQISDARVEVLPSTSEREICISFRP